MTVELREVTRTTVERLAKHVRTYLGAESSLVSHVKGAGRVGRFYSSLGLRYTGREEHGQLAMALERH